MDSVVTPKGFAGGVQIGYNWQGGRNWLVGFEADIQGTNQSDTACTPFSCFNQTVAGTPFTTAAITAQQQLDWFGTLRGRLGAVNNNILFYATGGAAFGRVKETLAGTFSSNVPTFSTSINTFNQVGWTVGGGIEAAVGGNWTAKAEYLYVDLGTIKSVLTDGASLTVNNTSTVRDHIFRAGVNYRFAGEPGRSW
jgi:outer membrane immunogenic protein